MKKTTLRIFALIVMCSLLTAMMLLFSSCKKSILDPSNPTKIVIWHYYNGRQLSAFNDMINEFNNTKGNSIGVYVEAKSQGEVDSLAEKIFASAEGHTGAEEMPNIFGAYADSAYAVNALGKVADIDNYLTPKEKDEYVKSFIEEGYLSGNKKSLKIFPVAKSSEIIMIYEEMWSEFANETAGITKEMLYTWEGIAEISEKYYKWSDEKTPNVKNDGKAFFGIDSLANYIIVGSKQLGTKIVQTNNGIEYNIDKAVFKKLWDIYYVSFVKGYFNAVGRYRSDDLKTGDIIAYLGSTTGSAYFPVEIADKNGSLLPVTSLVSPMPYFKDGEKVAIQQGAGMVVVKSSEREEMASVEFLKWFTESERNLQFASDSAYLPVKEDVLNGVLMQSKINELKSGSTTELNTGSVFETAIKQFQEYELFWSEPYDKSLEFRRTLGEKLAELSLKSKELYFQKLGEGLSEQEAYDSVNHDGLFEEWYNCITESAKRFQ